MGYRVVLGSFFSAGLLLLVCMISAVGADVNLGDENEGRSPLFVVRTQQATGVSLTRGVSAFVGKGSSMDLFILPAGEQGVLIKNALHFFKTHPAMLTKLLENVCKYPYLMGLLEKQGVSSKDIQMSLQMLQHNPQVFLDAIADGSLSASETDPAQPLGLSTSNPLGCLIVAMVALIPITVTLTLLLLLFTLRVLTCINFNNCANDLAQSIWEQLIQGLTQPGVTG